MGKGLKTVDVVVNVQIGEERVRGSWRDKRRGRGSEEARERVRKTAVFAVAKGVVIMDVVREFRINVG